MSSYMAALLGSMAVLVACGAVATLGRGWLPPWLRGRIVRPALFGWAQLAMTTALAAQLVGGLLITSQDVRFTVTMSGAMVMLLATGLIGLAQLRR
ncbi:hypothetical protein ACFXAW_14145 [Streptomyces sp. NPDC059445]|uniref:hypothetical protein n=1 Tax=unclassified Streptomyces TaxID=2593676 RepID=UPI0036A3EAA5